MADDRYTYPTTVGTWFEGDSNAAAYPVVVTKVSPWEVYTMHFNGGFHTWK